MIAKSSAVWQIVESASPEQLITSFASCFKYCDSILIDQLNYVVRVGKKFFLSEQDNYVFLHVDI